MEQLKINDKILSQIEINVKNIGVGLSKLHSLLKYLDCAISQDFSVGKIDIENLLSVVISLTGNIQDTQENLEKILKL